MATKSSSAKHSKKESVGNTNYDFNRLKRSSTDKVLGGVCKGLADFFNIDVTLVRLIFVLLVVFGGSGVLLYFVLWIIIPGDTAKPGISEENIKVNAEDIKNRAQQLSGYFDGAGKQENSRKTFGIIILILGVMFLLSNLGLFSFHWVGKLWPLILIFIAFAILTNGKK